MKANREFSLLGSRPVVTIQYIHLQNVRILRLVPQDHWITTRTKTVRPHFPVATDCQPQERAGGNAFVTWYVRNRSANEGDRVRLPIVNHIVCQSPLTAITQEGVRSLTMAIESTYKFPDVSFFWWLLGAFTIWRKASVSCLSAWNNSTPNGRIFMKSEI